MEGKEAFPRRLFEQSMYSSVFRRLAEVFSANYIRFQSGDNFFDVSNKGFAVEPCVCKFAKRTSYRLVRVRNVSLWALVGSMWEKNSDDMHDFKVWVVKSLTCHLFQSWLLVGVEQPQVEPDLISWCVIKFQFVSYSYSYSYLIEDSWSQWWHVFLVWFFSCQRCLQGLKFKVESQQGLGQLWRCSWGQQYLIRACASMWSHDDMVSLCSCFANRFKSFFWSHPMQCWVFFVSFLQCASSITFLPFAERSWTVKCKVVAISDFNSYSLRAAASFEALLQERNKDWNQKRCFVLWFICPPIEFGGIKISLDSIDLMVTTFTAVLDNADELIDIWINENMTKSGMITSPCNSLYCTLYYIQLWNIYHLWM